MTDQDDDARLGAYAPPTDEFATFDARDEDSRRGPLLLAAAFAVFVLFLGVVWSAYNQGLRESGRDGAPRLLANSEPYRERPLDPGGVQTPDTDMDVYDRLTGDDHSDEAVTTRPGPEEPLDESRPALRIETVDADQTGDQPAPESAATPDVTPRRAPDRPQPQQVEPETRPAAPVREAVREPEPAPVATPAASDIAVDTSGEWVVQIASFRSQADAEAAWLAFRTRFSSIAAGVAPDVAEVNIPERGVYHRLRIAAFASRDAAVAYCARLQQGGQDCLVARR
ncbi:SPOR domain-containing protein [uncultured Maricaulis sp.]|uniref:SPOR domain-containing protein n=1 Tax=uncultured Maricaulis sp. TaxID=174710 RepID=UPI0030DD8B87|tara:strand:- start:12892 stop:13740 length:849 start_codon:yes stop_codon:yes gene_type:complete